MVHVPWWKRPCEHAAQVPAVFASQWKVLFPFIDRVLDIAGMLQRQVRTVFIVQKSGESTAQFSDAVAAVPVVANDRNEWVEHAARSPGAPRRCFRPGH